jgi:hypothetical protein
MQNITTTTQNLAYQTEQISYLYSAYKGFKWLGRDTNIFLKHQRPYLQQHSQCF